MGVEFLIVSYETLKRHSEKENTLKNTSPGDDKYCSHNLKRFKKKHSIYY